MATRSSVALLAAALAMTVRTNDSSAQTGGTATAVGLGGGGSIFAPVVAAYDPNLIFVACDMGGVYRSKDNGQHWTMLDTRFVRISYDYNQSTQLAYYDFSVAIDRSVNPATDPAGRIHIVGYHSARGLMESFAGGDTGGWAPYSTPFPTGYQTAPVTSAAFTTSGLLYVGTTLGLLVEQRDASGNRSFTGIVSPDGGFIKRVVIVGPPAAPIAFAATENNVYRVDSSGGALSLTSITGALPAPPGGIRVQDFAGATNPSNPSRYVLYDTVNGWVDSNGNVQGGVFRYDSAGTAHDWVREETGLNYSIKPNDCASNTIAQYRYLAVSEADPDTAYVSVFNNQCSPNAYKRTSSTSSWDGAYYGFQYTAASNGATDNYTPGWANLLET